MKNGRIKHYYNAGKFLKTVLTLAMLFCGLQVRAQDTIEMPLDNYYYYWPKDKDTAECIDSTGYMRAGWINSLQEIAKEFYTDHPIRVHGIAVAACMCGSDWDSDCMSMSSSHLRDTSRYSSFECLRLYNRTGIGDELYVIAEDTLRGTDTASHYLFWGCHNSSNPVTMKPRRIFEKYFDNPVTVTGTFYVGMTLKMQIYQQDSTPSWKIYPITFLNSNYICSTVSPECANKARFHEYWTYHWAWEGWSNNLKSDFLFILPIFSPIDTVSPVDTIPDDPVGVGDMGMSHYVSLFPNPASGSVTIASSFGMSRIEVFDPSGRCVCDKPASGLSTTLDISHWPEDFYIVNVYTPVGRVTKRLVVR